MSTVDVAALREAAEGATPGPWDSAQSDARSIFGDGGDALVADLSGTWRDYENAAYIAAADPPTILALLDRLEAAEAAVERVRALIAERETEAAEASERLRERWANDPSHMKRDHQWRLGAVYGTADLRAALDGAQ